MATQSTVDKGQSATGSNNSRSKLELANNGFTNSGYVESPFGDDFVPSTGGYVSHPPVPSANGYIHNLPTSIDPRERDSRSRSAESGNEDDSTSNEGDAGSVFDDDVMPNLMDHIGRSRSTVTSGFQSGSSESASPEPPIKSSYNSPPPSPPTLSHHSHTQAVVLDQQ